VTRLTVRRGGFAHDDRIVWSSGAAMFPLIYPSTRLKFVAGFLAVLWVAAALSAAPLDGVHVAVTSAAGAVLAWLWYRLMDGPIPLAEMFDVDTPRGRRFGWIALIVVTGCVSFYLGSRVAALLPAGEWHSLLARLLVAMAWPALMWPLPSLALRTLFARRMIGAAR
jgi:hypothetical protein